MRRESDPAKRHRKSFAAMTGTALFGLAAAGIIVAPVAGADRPPPPNRSRIRMTRMPRCPQTRTIGMQPLKTATGVIWPPAINWRSICRTRLSNSRTTAERAGVGSQLATTIISA
jgi:hypothetical protein